MSEALSREDEAFVEALLLRRHSLAVRCTIAVVGALAFEPIVGTVVALSWLAVFLGIQLPEALVRRRVATLNGARLPLWLKTSAAACLFASHAAYGAIALFLWGHGLGGGACAMLILAGGAANAVMGPAGSRLALISTLSPIVAYFVISPWLLARSGAGPEMVLALGLASIIFGGFILAAYNQAQKLAVSERSARRISERRRNELESAASGKSAFIASVGHDLRTPLSAILTGASELERSARDGSERSQAALILDAGQMMNRLLDDLLDHSRLEAGRMQIEPVAVNIRDLIARACRFWQGQARAKGVKLIVEGGRFLPTWVEADPVRMRQILNNLLSNAVKFTDQGEVRVRLNAWPADDGRCALTIEVADTGAGMDADQQRRLFTAFDQTLTGVARSHGGSGLGLWISRSLARLMDGRLTARSAEGEGSAFTLALTVTLAEPPVLAPAQPGADKVGAGFTPLPAAPVELEAPAFAIEQEPEPVAAESGQTDPALEETGAEEEDRPLRVLVVDDHDINRRAVQLILTPLGCDIAQADNGRTALEMAMTQAFDVIFMDVRMPELDGRETTRRLRAADGPNQFAPVIAVTADTSPDDVKACADAGMTWFVGKPLTPATLLGALQGVLSGESRLEHDDSARAA